MVPFPLPDEGLRLVIQEALLMLATQEQFAVTVIVNWPESLLIDFDVGLMVTLGVTPAWVTVT